MLHDIILSLISEKESCIIKELLSIEIAENFLHPAEIKTLKDITKITGQYREIRRFVSQYSSYASVNNQLELETPLPAGLYLQAFANGLDLVLEKYHHSIVELEKKYLKKPTTSLLFIFHEVDQFRPLFEFLLRLINGIKTQRLTGCQILQFLQDNALHGNKTLMEAVLTIQKSVYTVFIQQLSQWIIYGKFSDAFGEFFISHAEGSDKRPTFSTQVSVNTYQSSEPSVNLDLWMYEINYDMLPYYFPKSWAEKVLFIGQTVLMFNSDPRDGTLSENFNNSVWGTREAEFFQKFHQLQEVNKLNVLTFEKIIDEVKVCVTEHLSEIAINEADLVKQLKLIKDFFMLGRGELFYEFIKGLYPIYGNVVTENTVRDINRIFHTAAGSVNIQDDELFEFEIIREDMDSFSYDQKGLFHFISLRYKIKWPLHLLFPPKVLDKYNELFRFLIRIRKTQYDLQMVWCHHRENKLERSNQLLQFRNKLMFLIDNLQYYLQVDVLESQFSIMMNKIQETRDFEQILRAHNFFLANVLGLCFLLESTEPLSKSLSASSFMENPVLTILNKILTLIQQFNAFAYICSTPMNDEDKSTFDSFEEIFASFVDSLLKMLSGLQASTPLAQLLLRLDYNYYFSTKNQVDY